MMHFQPGDAPGVLGRLALRVVEVGRNGDDGFAHRLAQIGFGVLLQLAQDLRRHFLRRDLLAAHLDPRVAIVGTHDLVRGQLDGLLHLRILEAPPDEALHRVDGVLRVGDRLALGGRAHEDFAILGVGDDRRGGARAFRVLDHLGLAALHDRDAGVRGAEVYADDFCHGLFRLNLNLCLIWGFRPLFQPPAWLR
jgi:hypothetical protein